MQQQLEQFQTRIGYAFTDTDLLCKALRHRSAGNDHNERLEFLGDSLLNLVAADYLFRQDGNASEGELTTRRSILVRKQTLARIARQFDFASVLQLGPSAAKSGGFGRDSILADTVEAVIAAVYLDSDFATVSRVTLALLREEFAQLDSSLDLQQPTQDAKTRLQEWLQARSLPLPQYETLEISGPDHQRIYQVSVCVEPLAEKAVGTGTSRREAEQFAAALALEQLEQPA